MAEYWKYSSFFKQIRKKLSRLPYREWFKQIRGYWFVWLFQSSQASVWVIQFLYFSSIHVIFRIHCFHNYEGQRCQDLEISHLIECEKSPMRSSVQMQRKLKQDNIQCVTQPHVTYPFLETSTSKMSTGKMPYLMCIYLLTSVFGF